MNVRPRVSPYLALVPVCAGVFIAADDQTVIVTILPQVMLDMDVPVGELERALWTITGYLLGYVAAMPLMGRLSDNWGHRRLFILSTAIFMAGSVAAALVTDMSWLVTARVVQAVGAGALVPISIAIVGDLFPPTRRGVPLGLVGASAEAGGVIGPLWGGLFVRFLDWRWVFWVNVPLGATVVLFLVLLLRPSPRHQAKVDYLGGALIAVSLAALTLGLARIDSADALLAGYFAVSGVTLALFILRQIGATAPLLPLSMFRGWAFSAANVTHMLVGGALIIAMVTIPLMADTVLGQAPLEGGLRLMRMMAAIAVGAILGGIISQRLSYGFSAVGGLALAAVGFLFMSRWDLGIADPAMTVHLFITGLGFGLLIAPIGLAAINSVEVENRGSAAATVTAMRMIGMTTGLAAMAAWGTNRFVELSAGLRLPLPELGETAEQTQLRVEQFNAGVTNVGLTLFNDFFLIAMVLCLIAIVPAALMAWKRGRIRD